MIKRYLLNNLEKDIDYKKALVILGPRQVGKSTIMESIATNTKEKILQVNGDNPSERMLWTNPSFATITQIIAPFKIIIIDEAQRIENIGLTVKMIVDAKLKKQIILSGSSSLEIASTINEPLTGRKWEHHMFPISWQEMQEHEGLGYCLQNLENFLVFGMYPEVLTNEENKIRILKEITNSYLYKDILELGKIRKPEILVRLLQALAFQVGSEVSYNELAQTIQADKETVINYINLLEKCFVVFKLNPLSRNIRNDISTSRKIYFYDNGVRNAIIENFKGIAIRDDIEKLWENFIIAERMKILKMKQMNAKTWFWRSKAKAEIDYIEEINGEIFAYELKWNEKAKASFSKTFTDFYNPTSLTKIDRTNFWDKLQMD